MNENTKKTRYISVKGLSTFSDLIKGKSDYLRTLNFCVF